MNADQESHSYRDLLRRVLPSWSDIRWLDDFLRSSRPPNAEGTTIHLCELLDQCEVTTVDDPATLRNKLAAQNSHSRGRIVIVQYPTTWSVDREIVDIVALHFNLDPCELIDHFCHHHVTRSDDYSAAYDDAQGMNTSSIIDLKNVWSYRPHSDLSGSNNDATLHSAVFGFGADGAYSKILQNSSGPQLLVLLRLGRSRSALTAKYLQLSGIANLLDVQEITQGPQDLKEYFISKLHLLCRDRIPNQPLLLEDILPELVEPFMQQAVIASNRFLLRYRTAARGTQLADTQELFDHYRDLQFLKGQLLTVMSKSAPSQCQQYIQQSVAMLDTLVTDLNHLRDWTDVNVRRQDDDYLHFLMDSQRQEMQSSLKASNQIGRLSRLAYIFLPVQLTTSILGMNLKVFGSGTLRVSTFAGILLTVGTIALSPIILPALFPWEIIHRAMAIWPHSHHVCLVFILFSLTQHRGRALMLWNDTGICYDIEVFQGRKSRPRRIDADGWAAGRDNLKTAIWKSQWAFLARFWTKQLREVYKIIDKQNWGNEVARDSSGHQRGSQPGGPV